MDRCYLANTSETAPEAPVNSSGYPTAGSKVTGTPATVPGPYWFHAVTEEIRNCVTGSGQTPDSSDLHQLYKAMMLLAHPIGSIYESTDATSPAKLFGGTWEAIKDRMLIGAGDSFGAGTTGGGTTHRLTVDEMPAHSHAAGSTSAGDHTHYRGSMNITGGITIAALGGDKVMIRGTSGAFSHSGEYAGGYGQAAPAKEGFSDDISFNAANAWTGETSWAGAHTHEIWVGNTGGGKAFSTMSPYLAVYIWRRVA